MEQSLAQTILPGVSKWHEEGSIQEAEPSGRPYSIHTPENIAWVLVSVDCGPRHSIIKRSLVLLLPD
jgi:hypothetical protein